MRNYPIMSVSFLVILIFTPTFTIAARNERMMTVSEGVRLHVDDQQVMIENGILQLTLSKPQGHVTGIKYNGIENLLQVSRRRNDLGGYWDVTWSNPLSKQRAFTDMLDGTDFKVIAQSEDQVEVSFRRKWTPFRQNNVVLNIDKRFIMLRGVSGFYTYAIFEHEKDWPGLDISEARLVFKLRPDRFNYMAISDHKQRRMPSMVDRLTPRAIDLAYKEATLLVNPIEPQLKGQVDDKYQYSLDNKDNRVHGWISSNSSTGFWIITPSDEFKTGGPLKQDLTSHAGPVSLAMFIGDHYIGRDIHFRLDDGEYWKKTLGPVFIYLNSNSSSNFTPNTKNNPFLYPNRRNVHSNLWNDAKAQMRVEVKSWPYNFPASNGFLKSNQRGSITGRLVVRDRYISRIDIPADMAYVGLALPGEPGSWQIECKGYQFWTRADFKGNFVINNVRPGIYNIYAWVPGVLGDFMHSVNVSISPGHKIKLGELVFEPPRTGPTLWEIGIPDRSAAEFYIPDPDLKYVNKLFIHTEKYRQYGLWQRYSDLYPNDDLVYQIGSSNYRKDWFFAQVVRKVGNNLYRPTTWKIKFRLVNVDRNGLYMLRIALATSYRSRLQVRVNNLIGEPHFTTGEFGDGNAIARHGIHGFQWNFDVAIEGKMLINGENTICLTQSRGDYVFNGIMYDYIRLEGPKTSRQLFREDYILGIMKSIGIF